ncbi:hypothetical protein Bca52824_021845 [Brassica carinata]|uniref:Uncharacterized protein n=1 Tax=Brassica carinata TaxID=52824 RepID=A0A8X7VFL7_BRACI|nr:hypothetical protein Bca52824_021845 [Brassica carinata]
MNQGHSCTRTGSGATKPSRVILSSSSLFLPSDGKKKKFFLSCVVGFAMAVHSGMDLLSERAVLMRQSLQKSQTITDNVVSILGSFDSRLSALESAMRPTQIRTHAIRKAHENIDKTLKAAEVILSQFHLLRQAESKVLKGPHEDLESYLEAIAQLRKIIRYFSSNKSFKSSDGVLNHANSLLAKAQSKLEDEFKQLLASYRFGLRLSNFMNAITMIPTL